MITIEATATVTPEGKVTIQLPATISPGNHKLVLVIDEQPVVPETRPPFDFPVHHVGVCPDNLSPRREDMYDTQPRRSLRGVCAESKIDVTEADIAEARREMWATFPRENL